MVTLSLCIVFNYCFVASTRVLSLPYSLYLLFLSAYVKSVLCMFAIKTVGTNGKTLRGLSFLYACSPLPPGQTTSLADVTVCGFKLNHSHQLRVNGRMRCHAHVMKITSEIRITTKQRLTMTDSRGEKREELVSPQHFSFIGFKAASQKITFVCENHISPFSDDTNNPAAEICCIEYVRNN